MNLKNVKSKNNSLRIEFDNGFNYMILFKEGDSAQHVLEMLINMAEVIKCAESVEYDKVKP